MIDKEFAKLLKKLIKENRSIFLGETRKFSAFLKDECKNEYNSESDLLVTIHKCGCIKQIEMAKDINACIEKSVKELEDKFSLSQKKSFEMLELLVLLLRGEKLKPITTNGQLNQIPKVINSPSPKKITNKQMNKTNGERNNKKYVIITSAIIGILFGLFFGSIPEALIGASSLVLFIGYTPIVLIGIWIVIWIICDGDEGVILNKHYVIYCITFFYLAWFFIPIWNINKGLVTKAISKTYIGSYQDGKPEGVGSISIRDGRIYYGEFTNGLATGNGIITYKNGETYEGSVKNARPNGFGVYIWSNENKYEGEWKNKKRHGKGVFTWSNGDIYNGDWKKNKKHGIGVLSYSNGNKYEGDFTKDERVGNGVFTFSNGKTHTGEWKFARKGRMTYRNSVYEGRFVEKTRHGYGKMYFSDEIYEGKFKNNLYHGLGTFVWADGGKYEGEWKNGVKSGRGKHTDSCGFTYMGEFLDDKYHGNGIIRDPSGNILREGIFENGKLLE